MKAKDYIIIGGAIALFLLWKQSKTKKVTTTTGGSGSAGGTGSTGATQGFAMPLQGGTSATNEPEQVFGLSLPSGMDLPVLTAGTGVPTEVAVQQGGVVTTPTPAIVETPPLAIEESLVLGGIKPIKRPLEFEPAPIVITPKPEPVEFTPRPRPTLTYAEL